MIQCPQCGREIPPGDFNVSTDLAYCRNCDKSHRFSLLSGVENSNQDNPGGAGGSTSGPVGTSWRLRFARGESGRVISYRVLSPVLLFLAPFAVFWIVMVLKFPFGEMPGPGEVFRVVFLLASLLLIGIVIFLALGTIELRERNGEWEVFSGVGPFGRTRRFSASDVVSVETRVTHVNNRHPCYAIVIRLKNGSRCKFGSAMSEKDRDALCDYLRREWGC